MIGSFERIGGMQWGRTRNLEIFEDHRAFKNAASPTLRTGVLPSGEIARNQSGLATRSILARVNDRDFSASANRDALHVGAEFAQHNLSRLLDRIEREGLIERAPCPQDGRGHVLRLTARGHSMRNAMWPIYAQAIEAAVGSHLGKGEAETLSALLGRIIDGAVSGEPKGE
jgi:hypothetical protein